MSNLLDNVTGAQLAADPRLARAWSRAARAEAKRLHLPASAKTAKPEAVEREIAATVRRMNGRAS